MYQACTVLVPLISGLDPFGSGRRWTVLMNLAKSPDICRNLFQVHDHSGGIAKEPRTALREKSFFHVFFDIFEHVYRRVLSCFIMVYQVDQIATWSNCSTARPETDLRTWARSAASPAFWQQLKPFSVYSNYMVYIVHIYTYIYLYLYVILLLFTYHVIWFHILEDLKADLGRELICFYMNV